MTGAGGRQVAPPFSSPRYALDTGVVSELLSEPQGGLAGPRRPRLTCSPPLGCGVLSPSPGGRRDSSGHLSSDQPESLTPFGADGHICPPVHFPGLFTFCAPRYLGHPLSSKGKGSPVPPPHPFLSLCPLTSLTPLSPHPREQSRTGQTSGGPCPSVGNPARKQDGGGGGGEHLVLQGGSWQCLGKAEVTLGDSAGPSPGRCTPGPCRVAGAARRDTQQGCGARALPQEDCLGGILRTEAAPGGHRGAASTGHSSPHLRPPNVLQNPLSRQNLQTGAFPSHFVMSPMTPVHTHVPPATFQHLVFRFLCLSWGRGRNS